jgi:hypothetical protein
MVGKKPEKKPYGRDGPPKGYPRDQSQYADPENWRYPLHTPWHARAARRYFDDWSNRGKYKEEERIYIDWRINETLKKYDQQTSSTKEGKRPAPNLSSSQKAESLSLRQLLQMFLGTARLKRATEIEDLLVSIQKSDQDQINGHVKNYVVQINIKNRTITHDCQDWRKNMESKNMCKHLGKFLMTLDETKATELLRDVVKNKDLWTFMAPENG